MKKYLILSLLALSSCNLLDQNSPNDVDADNVFKSEEGANSALIGLYNTMQSRDYYGGFYPMVADLYSDIGTAGGFDNINLDEISALAVTPSNLISENMYLAMYQTIATANAIITKVPDIDDADFEDEEKDHIVGQALAIRALAHFDLLRLYGEHWNSSSNYGIPVIKTIQKASDIVGRSTVAQTYTAILDDLSVAMSLVHADDRSQATINPVAIQALRARVKLYQGDEAGAIADANAVISDGEFDLMDENAFTQIYTGRFSEESLFELTFDVQNRSAYNSITFSREDALRTEVLFLAEESMDAFFQSRSGDLRAELLDFNPDNNAEDIVPDGRTQKYRGEATRDNPAYIIRMAEMYLILAEAKGYASGGLANLNEVRENRGLMALVDGVDVSDQSEFLNALLDERKAELNFEGHRIFDLARTGQVNTVLGIEPFRSIFPIPLREVNASKGAVVQSRDYD